MTHTPGDGRRHSGRWARIVLAAALAAYGVAGFPHPGRPDPSTASAHPLPGFPHVHGGNPICGYFACPPPSDGTTERPDDGGGNRPGGSRPGGTGPSNCVGAHASGCRQGIEQGYINPGDDLDEAIGNPQRIAQMGETFAEKNPDVVFDTDDFAEIMNEAERPPRRGDVADALCAAVANCSGTGDDAIQYLLDNGISFGQTDDTLEGFNPANPVTIGQMGSFFQRLPTDDERDERDDRSGGGDRRDDNRDSGGDDPDVEACTTGLDLSDRQRSGFASELGWVTLVAIEAQGEPDRSWPPHPDVPGGAEYLVVSRSPVWPVLDPDASWHVASDDGCLWEAVSVQTRLTQLLPWRTSHRSMIENADAARPGAGLDTYLSRWDNLSAAQQAQAEQQHRDADIDTSCGITTAMSSDDSYNGCRWELATPGVWSWQARACFEGVTEDATFRQCATLAEGVEWFLEIIDYTSGITLQNDPAGSLPGSRRAAQTG